MSAPAACLSAVLLLSVACTSGLQTVHAPTQIPWNRAEELILEGNVARIQRWSEAELRLHLKDGRSVVVRPPDHRAVESLIERCGEPCGGLAIE
ncbi:MAG TPA: hypothetical protein VMS56_07540 [Thermoanaerobaculia bacterium]|nr:hypothetical protein [Thermoanaerobaculia bacterium]